MSLSIPISGLNKLSVVTSSDFIPIVQSSSMLTTYRTPLSVIATWISSSVEASSSFSTVSSSHANISNVAILSNLATLSTNTDNLNYPNTSTAFHAISADYATNAGTAITASFALSVMTGSTIPTSSLSFYSQTSLSASWASASFSATSASWASSSISAKSASWASSSISAKSASWSSNSSHSIQADSASYAIKSGPTFIASVPLSLTSSNIWITVDATSFGVSSNASAVILQYFIFTGQGPQFVFGRSSALGLTICTASVGALGGGDVSYIISQMIVPTTTNAHFDYMTPGGVNELSIIGYF